MRKCLYICVFLLALLPCVSQAQFLNMELPVYIELHKGSGPVTFARSAAERINEKLHSKLRDSAEEVKASSDSLGFYYKAFNWVDVIYQSLRFGYNVKNTYQVTTEKVVAINNLLEGYISDVAETRDIEADDMEIIRIGRDLFHEDSVIIAGVWPSFVKVIGFAALKQPVTTYSLLTELKKINDAMEAIQANLNKAYERLSWYILIRRGWHWRNTYVTVNRVDVAEWALKRWHDASVESMKRVR